jgi:hypothetical protein
MVELRYTLLTDGSSDKTLMNIIKWTLDDIYPKLSCSGNFADIRSLPNPPSSGDVLERIKTADKYYPFDILFYHRDAEKAEKDIIKKRKSEIFSKVDEQLASKIVCVVPVTMMETWLLINQEAIKKASGNRNYSDTISLPALSKLETIKDSKKELHHILKICSNLKGRREKTFNVHSVVHRVAEYIGDYSPLRQLSAFIEFENDLKTAVDNFLCNK